MTTTVLSNQVIGARQDSVVIASASLNANADTFGENLNLDSIQSVSLQISGTFVGTVVAEISNDKVTWNIKTLYGPSGAAVSSFTTPSLVVGDLGARYFRVRVSAYTSGTIVATIYGNSDSVSTPVSSQGVTNTILGTGATNGWKTEDAVHASGDVGIMSLGVRAPTTPVTATSGAADYGYFMIDQEGKQVLSGTGAAEHAWQARIDLTTTSDVGLKSSAGAGVRNYVTDLILDNSGASPARFILKDNTTAIFSVTIPANSSIVVALKTPLRGAAATVVNGALVAAGTVGVTISGFIGI